MLYGYIDRSDSSTGSSEKSQKVHSINYKIGVVLQKEIQSLNVEEKNVACSIAVNQRIQTTRFRNKLRRSAELTKHHDKLRERFFHEEAKPRRNVNIRTSKHSRTHETKTFDPNQEFGVDSDKPGQRQSNVNNKTTKDNFSFKTFADFGASKNRPQTALESKTKQWNKNADAARERVVRAKSAPPNAWRNCSDIMRQLHGSGGYADGKKHRKTMSRAKFGEIFDMESFREFRAQEIAKEKNKVNALVETLEPLKLEPWYPGPSPIKEKRLAVKRHSNEGKTSNKFSSFITRVDSIL